MDGGEIVAVHVGLIRSPRFFVVQRKAPSGRDTFEVFKPQTLRQFVTDLLTILNTSRTDFMARLEKLDDDQWMKSKHKTRRYIADEKNHVYLYRYHLEKHVEQLFGYWVATNIGRREVNALTNLACEAAGVRRRSAYKFQF